MGRGGDCSTMEYLGTARMASHLGMAEMSKRGREVRDFFFDYVQHAPVAPPLQLASRVRIGFGTVSRRWPG